MLPCLIFLAEFLSDLLSQDSSSGRTYSWLLIPGTMHQSEMLGRWGNIVGEGWLWKGKLESRLQAYFQADTIHLHHYCFGVVLELCGFLKWFSSLGGKGDFYLGWSGRRCYHFPTIMCCSHTSPLSALGTSQALSCLRAFLCVLQLAVLFHSIFYVANSN